MKNTIVLASAVSLFGASGLIHAQESREQTGYVGVNYVAFTYEEDGFSEELDLGALSGKLGGHINPYLAGEVRVGLGVQDESVSAFGATAELELDSYVGIYLLAGIPNESPVYPYLVIGGTQANLTVSASGPGGSFSDSGSEADVSYGFGAKLDVTETVHLNAEYMQYLDKDGFEISGISVGGAVRF